MNRKEDYDVRYQYVSVEGRYGLAKTSFEEHREIIDRFAADGWRFVGAIPTLIVGYGMIKRLDLVFEKQS